MPIYIIIAVTRIENPDSVVIIVTIKGLPTTQKSI